MRVQLAFNIRDLEETIEHYSALFGIEVTKRKPRYANFAIDEPPLKRVLFEHPEADERLNHRGVEVFAQADVHRASDRLTAAGKADLVEDETTCCDAKASMVWSADPQGLRWEFYRVVEDSESFFGNEAGAGESATAPARR